jgi:D-amino-acid oxidase
MKLVDHRRCEPKELPTGFQSGVFYTTPMIEIPVFMPWLSRQFQRLGGVIEIRKLNNLEELLVDTFQPLIIVNCCGLGK